MPVRIERSTPAIDVALLQMQFGTAGTFEVDLFAASEVEDALKDELARETTRLLLDVKDVTYIHSRAFWAVVRAGEELSRRGGRLVILRPTPYLRRLVELTSAAEALEMADEMAEALAAVRGTGAAPPARV